MPNILSKTTSYLKEVKVELKKVNWPTRQEAVKYTFIVIGISAAVALFLAGLDLIFNYLIRFII